MAGQVGFSSSLFARWSLALVLALGSTSLGPPALAASTGPSSYIDGAISVITHRFDSLQFIICFQSNDPSINRFSFSAGERISYDWTLRDLAGEVKSSGHHEGEYIAFSDCTTGYLMSYSAELMEGTSYTITTTSSVYTPGVGTRSFEHLNVFTTRGGCPVNAPESTPVPYTYYYAVVNAQNEVLPGSYVIAPGTVASGFETIPPGNKWAPIWAMVRDGYSEPRVGYIYDPVREDFGPSVDAGLNISEYKLLKEAGATECKRLGYDISFSTEADAEVCEAVEDGVQATGEGVCPVGVKVSSPVSTKSTSTNKVKPKNKTFKALFIVQGSAGPPGYPDAVKGAARVRSAEVSWHPPFNRGGARITSYAVTSEPASYGCQTAGELRCSVSGLKPGVAYRFSVTATNKYGTSDSSYSSPEVVPFAKLLRPTAVENFGGTPVKGAVQLRWDPPLSMGGASSVTYQYRVGKNAWKSTSLRVVKIKGKRGVSLTLAVRALNAAGAGPVRKLTRKPR